MDFYHQMNMCQASFKKKKGLLGFLFVCLFVLVVSDSEFVEEGVWPLSQGRVSIGCSKAQGWGFMTISGEPPNVLASFKMRINSGVLGQKLLQFCPYTNTVTEDAF